MKSIATVGDLHGRMLLDEVRSLIKNNDMTVFLGDYLDPYSNIEKDVYTGNQLIKYLLDIIEIKKNNPDKVILLLGNHDTHYFCSESCTRYDRSLSVELKKIYTENLDLFQIAYQEGQYLWTHAGVTKKWIKKYKDILTKHNLNSDYSNLADVLNNLFKGGTFSDQFILFECGPQRGGDFYSVGGPIWSDYRESSLSVLPGIHQFVGHTYLPEITEIKRNNGDGMGFITYCDVLGAVIDFKVVKIDY